MNRKILCVDDEQSVLDVVCQVVANDYEPLCARTVKDATELFLSEKPFLVITDLRLHNHVDGATMASRLHSADPACVFVAISGYLDVFEIGYLLGSVFTDLIQKPFKADVLSKIINYAYEKRQRWENYL